jgi:hypothetical protein
MPNHFHLFVETPLGNIDRFMDRLGTAYAMYFRYKHYRPGHCFQGRYKAPLVQGDDYIIRLTRYIHLNPVCVEGIRDWEVKRRWSYLRAYPWSSLRGYLAGGRREEFVDYRWLSLFGGEPATASRAYSRYIRRQIGEEDDVLREAFDAGPYAVGDADFVAEVGRWVKAASTRAAAPQDVIDPGDCPSLDQIELAVLDEFGISPSDLRAKHSRVRNQARCVFIELACTVGQSTQRAAAAHLRTVSEHLVGKSRRAFRRECAQDRKLKRRMERLLSSF